MEYLSRKREQRRAGNKRSGNKVNRDQVIRRKGFVIGKKTNEERMGEFWILD
jgi:hypothetical protein